MSASSGPWEGSSSYARHFADAVRRRRVAAGLNQSQLAQRAGLGRMTITFIETYRTVPKADTQAAIAGALGVSLTELTAEAERLARERR